MSYLTGILGVVSAQPDLLCSSWWEQLGPSVNSLVCRCSPSAVQTSCVAGTGNAAAASAGRLGFLVRRFHTRRGLYIHCFGVLAVQALKTKWG